MVTPWTEEAVCVGCGKRFAYLRKGSKPRLRCERCRVLRNRETQKIYHREARRRAREAAMGGPNAVRREDRDRRLDDSHRQVCTCGGDYMTKPLGHVCEGPS